MSRFGVGPAFTLTTLAYAAIAFVVSRTAPAVFGLPVVPYWVLVAAGALLIGLGTAWYVMALRAIMRAYHADALCTTGPAALCRHPIYASWIVLIIPGLCLLMNSWPALTVPVFAYVVARVLVRKEEAYLTERFGEAYRAYQRQVPAIIPRPWRRAHTRNDTR